MTATAKLKVSLSLSADLVALVDRDARRLKGTRSGVIEHWLRRAATASAQAELAEATVAYYDSLRSEDRAEEEALSRALSASSRRVRYGAPPTPSRRPRDS